MSEARRRVIVDLGRDVDMLLTHVSQVLGIPRAQVVSRVLVDALPGMVDLANGIVSRVDDLKGGASHARLRRANAAASSVLDGYVDAIGDDDA